mmetsp:Transcript_35115/g.98597  ORF Transcript_35115/g.98597 Transcript_35115/m.98597 type:complete len:258 (+) Transcript_35115:290-1063(+)
MSDDTFPEVLHCESALYKHTVMQDWRIRTRNGCDLTGRDGKCWHAGEIEALRVFFVIGIIWEPPVIDAQWASHHCTADEHVKNRLARVSGRILHLAPDRTGIPVQAGVQATVCVVLGGLVGCDVLVGLPGVLGQVDPVPKVGSRAAAREALVEAPDEDRQRHGRRQAVEQEVLVDRRVQTSWQGPPGRSSPELQRPRHVLGLRRDAAELAGDLAALQEVREHPFGVLQPPRAHQPQPRVGPWVQPSLAPVALAEPLR